MGAGHDGAARELARRLEGRGHTVAVRDFLEAGPLRIGPALRSGYEFELRHVPSAYDATYRFWHRVPWMAPVVAWLAMALSHRRVMAWVRDVGADAVVSTYPLSTLCLGRLRTTGRLLVPAINFITDFGVHPLWVHRGMDLNLAVHDGPARLARERTGRPGVACGPLVAERFAPERAAGSDGRTARRSTLGLGDEDVAVLIVAGSWGVGGLRETFESVAAIPGAVPVVICGRDEVLQRRVTQAAAALGVRAVVLGWTDEMPALMAVSDVLVENAGGLTAFEAMRVGLPVVSYRPIAGHGVENTAAMAEAGVSIVAADTDELAAALRRVGRPGPARDEQVATGRAMFVSDAADWVLAAIPPGPLPLRRRGRPPGGLARRLAGSIAAVAAQR
jgi:UDP-N-acetylglucosamine:LPS N-acetylglucosamine transferase